MDYTVISVAKFRQAESITFDETIMERVKTIPFPMLTENF